ncbi:hypothetical protein CR513_26275, partial [Mucuna pruriens]
MGADGRKKGIEKNIWNKISIFFDLPYLCKLDVRHCMDVMHVEKNVCDSVIDMFLNIQGNTKDGLNTRLDLLALQSVGNQIYMPLACHTMSKKEKRSFLWCLKGIKVP